MGRTGPMRRPRKKLPRASSRSIRLSSKIAARVDRQTTQARARSCRYAQKSTLAQLRGALRGPKRGAQLRNCRVASDVAASPAFGEVIIGGLLAIRESGHLGRPFRSMAHRLKDGRRIRR